MTLIKQGVTKTEYPSKNTTIQQLELHRLTSEMSFNETCSIFQKQ